MTVDTGNGNIFFKQTLSSNSIVTFEEAIFRGRGDMAFKPANLQEHKQFGEEEILKEHP